jgi:Ribonuclease G/E
MTLEGSREAIGQKDINTLAVAESSRSNSQRGTAQIMERHCGTCGKTGHNRRTCQIVVVISGEEYSD